MRDILDWICNFKNLGVELLFILWDANFLSEKHCLFISVNLKGILRGKELLLGLLDVNNLRWKKSIPFHKPFK